MAAAQARGASRHAGDTLTVPTLPTLIVRGVRARGLTHGALGAVSLGAGDLGQVAESGAELLAYLRRLAGVGTGEVRIYVDGLPADNLPPADRIQSITINGDPFSAAYSDGTATRIDVTTKGAERVLRLRNVSLSRGPGARDGLDSRLTASASSGSAGLMGPVPRLPLGFTVDMTRSDQRRDVPIAAVVPATGDLPRATLRSASTGSASAMQGASLGFVSDSSWRADASLYALSSDATNVNVSGVTLPAAGSSQRSDAREFHATVSRTGQLYTYTGGIAATWSSERAEANARTLGIIVPGTLADGGAAVSQDRMQRARWTMRHAVEFSVGLHPVSVGTSITRSDDRSTLTPNAAGQITFSTLSDYLSATTVGAHTGTALVTTGQGNARHASTTAAVFIEGDMLATATASVRGGLRADYQSPAGGVLVSPRVSAATTWRGFVLKAGAGLFVDEWSNALFLRVMQHDGNHLQQTLTAHAALADVSAGGAAATTRLVSARADDLTPARNWISRVSVERPMGPVSIGGEYTWTVGMHRLGSRRLASPAGWIDMLESNRGSREQRLQLRARYATGMIDLSATYDVSTTRDNTDGASSFPARQGDLAAEWGPAAGTPRHGLTATARLKLGASTTLTLIDTWRGPVPVNVTSGVDAEGNGLYTDRGGRARNSGVLPSFHSMDLYANRRMALRLPGSDSSITLHWNVGLQVVNLTGSRSVLNIGTVIGSPLFLQPLAAAAGRSVRITIGL